MENEENNKSLIPQISIRNTRSIKDIIKDKKSGIPLFEESEVFSTLTK